MLNEMIDITIFLFYGNAHISLPWAILQSILCVSGKEYYSRWRHMSTYVHRWHSQKKLDGWNMYKI